MPTRKIYNEPTIRKHVLLFKSDWDLLEENFLKRGMSISYFIRVVVRAALKQAEAKVEGQALRLDAIELDSQDLADLESKNEL